MCVAHYEGILKKGSSSDLLKPEIFWPVNHEEYAKREPFKLIETQNIENEYNTENSFTIYIFTIEDMKMDEIMSKRKASLSSVRK